MTPTALVEHCQATLEPLEAEVNRAWWNANTDASNEHQRRRAVAELAMSDALADTETFVAIRSARSDRALETKPARMLALLEQAYTPHQADPDLRRRIVELQSSIDARFARHRGTIGNEAVDENAILDVLRTSTDVAHRQAAWDASKSVGPVVAADVRELARLRNEVARSLGYRDYFAMALATTEYDEGRLLATLDAVDAATTSEYRHLKATLDEQRAARFDVAVDALRPWHYDDPFLQETPIDIGVDLDDCFAGADLQELTARTYASVGIDVGGVLGCSDLLPRPGKVQHAFCIDVDRRGDVRVLCNIAPNERWAETMLHEFGHAAYFCGVSDELPWLLRTMHMALTEGVALRCGRLIHEPEWLHKIAGLHSTQVAELAPRLRAARRAHLLLFARWTLVMTNFERRLYANPDGALDELWWDLVERFQLVHRPDSRDAPDWAAKIHIAVAPVYYQNYLYGELIASQLTHAFGPLVDDPDAGRALVAQFFAPGATPRWDRLIETATGSALSPNVLVHDLAS